MTALRSDFDTNLDRILAMRVDPAVPPDLARRIVVRATCLPQSRQGEVQDRRAARNPPGLAQDRRFARRSLPAGTAIAASLLLFALWQGAANQSAPVSGSRADGIESAAPGRVIAKADALPATLPASSEAPAMVSRQLSPVRLAASRIGPVPARGSDEALTERDDDRMPTALPAQVGARAGEAAFAYVEAPEGHSALSGFTLAGKASEPALPVYGPVLEPETRWSHRGLSGRSSSSAGMAVAPSMAARAAR